MTRNRKLKKALFDLFAKRYLLILLAVFISITTSGQNENVIQGTVTDSSNSPVIGATIQQIGTNKGTVTDTNGHFSINIPLGSTIRISYVGCVTQNVKANSANLSIRLADQNTTLNDVVVIGYGIQQKKLVTGATVQIKGDDIAKKNVINPLTALQSSSPGVSLTQASGMPGDSYKIYIRGLGTTGDATPLCLIDGIEADINTLNPADIESIDILKDAATAAIYGSRAANGVILVTTKQGHSGKAQISYDGYVGWQNVYKMPDLLNAKEYAMIMNEERYEDGLEPYDFSKLVPDWDKIVSGKWNGTNWMDKIRNKNALETNHTINITGGSNYNTYSTGLSYTYQDGILGKPCEPNYRRYTARINSDNSLIRYHNFSLLSIGERLTYTFSQSRGIQMGDNFSNDIRNMLKASPFLPDLDSNGNYHYSIPWEIREPNPIALMDYQSGQNKSKSHYIRASLYATLQPIRNLKIKTNLGFALSVDSYRSFIPVYDLSSNQKNDQNIVSQSSGIDYKLQWENTANYVFSIRKSHHFDILVGQSIEADGLGDEMEGSNTNSIFNDFKHAYLKNTPIISSRTTLTGFPQGKTTLASFFGRINYDYLNRYMATVVLRADGSSKFAKGHQWGYFPSVSAGWAITEEPFMAKVRQWMDFFKIRASWGQNGNQNIPGYQYLSTYAFNGSDYTFGPDKSVLSNGAYADILANPDITWETSEQTDIGFDSRFFSSRFGITFDYYIKKTKDWLVQAPILATAGTNAPYINGGDVKNTGVEFSLSWNDHASALHYGAEFNFAYNKNKVTRIANSEGIIHGEENVLSQATDEMYRAQVGKPIGFFYGFKTAGIFQNQQEIENYKGAKLENARPGDVIWVDTNHDGKIDLDDRTMIGDPHPDCTLGLNLNASWHGFDLNASLNGVLGNQIMKSYRSFVDYPTNNFTTDILKRWHGDGTSTKWPRLTSGTSTNWQWISDLFMENGDYMRMQNLSIGYDFKYLFHKIPFQQLRFYFSANNLFTITGYSGMDPEVGYGGSNSWSSGIDLGFYPSPRTYMFGFDIKL
jgi:TonB-linked SusC/RagA family outer membrane protein